MQELYFITRALWRDWLAKNHDRKTGVWLVLYKKESGVPTLSYEDVVEEALCFGWVDSLIRNRDERSFARKVTPRNDDSKWSAVNIKRVDKLIKLGLMTQAGLRKIAAAKQSGQFKPAERPKITLIKPAELELALRRNKQARDFFIRLAPSYQRHYVGWVALAKRPETRIKRIRESLRLLEQGKKLGLK